jgi:outer membrane immunogenic protein
LKHLLIFTAAALAASASAHAADVPVRQAAPAPLVMAAPVFSWSGFYVGVNVGSAWGGDSDAIVTPPNTFVYGERTRLTATPSTTPYGTPTYIARGGVGTFLFPNDRDRAFGGAQIGYNIQFGSFVAGVEVDAQSMGGRRHNLNSEGIGFEGTGLTTVPADTPLADRDAGRFTGYTGRGATWFGTARGRLGFALDKILIFGTGGLAYGGGSRNTFGESVGSGTGWVWGAGAEWAVTDNVTVKFEALRVNLGNYEAARVRQDFVATGFTAGPVTDVSIRRRDEFNVIRAGLNYKFGWASAPAGAVVAAY